MKNARPPPRSGAQTRRAVETDPRWDAVVARDGTRDGSFYYSVESTGVYCRPSCGARRPKPEHVRFHGSRAEAEARGYRACLRCRPDQPGLAGRHAALIAEACRKLERSQELPSLADLAGAAGLSRSRFHRIFKALVGTTPKAYGRARRAERLRAEVGRARSVTEAIYGAGFGSSGRFYAEVDAALGMTPSEYRSGGRNVEISFAAGQCSLGSILVARSRRGVCAILMGDDPEALLRDLQDRFPHAALVGADRGFEELIARVVGLVESPGGGLELPLDVRGTAFQKRVWEALRKIPPGTTVSYTELARRLGTPKGARAVAGACAANPLAVAIPCHRVVRSDGGLSGYAWGIERKRALLERERTP